MYKWICLFAGLLMAGAAATAQNPFRIDPSTDFSKYTTYEWDQSKNSDRVTNQADAQIIDALQAELAKKGLTKSDSDAADVLICYHSNFRTEQVRRYTITEGAASFAWTIKTAQVAVDMIDSSTKKLIWHNTADLNPKAKPQQIAKAVSNLLSDYPPKK